MKKVLSFTLFALMILTSLPPASAQTASLAELKTVQQSSAVPAVGFLISIPDELQSRVVRENGTDAVRYHFLKADGGTIFLFQVSKISEYQWLQIKNQLDRPLILEHQNGFIYYAIVSRQYRLKGVDRAEYEKVHNQVYAIVNSIVITEAELN
jgi:hypothetical protein